MKVAYMEKYHLSSCRGGDDVFIKETQGNVGGGKMETPTYKVASSSMHMTIIFC